MEDKFPTAADMVQRIIVHFFASDSTVGEAQNELATDLATWLLDYLSAQREACKNEARKLYDEGLPVFSVLEEAILSARIDD